MSNALVRYEMNDEQVGLVKRMIAKDATNDELQLFLHQCQRTGLDPFSKQIYAISRYSKDAGRKVMAIQVSIDGARLIAERTGKYDNQEGPYWCGEDGQWVDVWLAKTPPRAAKVLVYKVGSNRATTGIAHWDEYHDSRSSFWQSKPALMLAKCAEMLALRKAFPQELSGLYVQEEMGQADVIEVDGKPVDAEPAMKEVRQIANPFDDTTPYYVTAWRRLTGKHYDLVDWIQQLHRNQSGPCSKDQYGYLTGIIDALTSKQHGYTLSVLCQSEINKNNVPSKDAASALIKFLANDPASPNPKFRQDMADMVTEIAQAQAEQVAA